MADRQRGDARWDLDLIPLTSELRQQRAAHRLLGKIYDQAERQQLPPLEWRISRTGTLIGNVDPFVPAAARAVFDSWAGALGLRREDEWQRDEVTYLRANGKRDGVNLILTAEETGVQPIICRCGATIYRNASGTRWVDGDGWDCCAETGGSHAPRTTEEA